MPVIETKGAASSGGFGQFARQVAANYIEDVFSTYLYTGNGSTQTITNGIDVSGSGGLVWIKKRNASESHFLVNSANPGFRLETDGTGAQASQSVLSLTSSGFSLLLGNGAVNGSGSTYASWTFRKQAKFFDVVTYTGDGVAGRTISHSLGSVPGCIIVKRTNTAANWVVWHRSLSDPSKYLVLNSAAATATDTGGPWGPFNEGYTTNASAFTDTFFRVANDIRSNAIDGTYVAYLFAHDAGGFGAAGTDNVISCGSFTTDGSGNATVSLGWEPQWIMRKTSSSAANGWEIGDNMRGMPAPPTNGPFLRADSSLDESSLGSRTFGPTATGFIATGSPSTTYIYMAIRRGPMRTPTSGTSVYNPAFLSSGLYSAGFPIDFAMSAQRTGDTYNSYVADRLRGGNNGLITTQTNAEYADPAAYFDNMLGYRPGVGTSTNQIAWMFRRAPGFFDVVCYTGTGSATTFSHNLGVAPELMIIKGRNSSFARAWVTYHVGLGVSQYILVNSNAGAVTTSTAWNNTAPTSTVFTVGTLAGVNYDSTERYVAYLFSSCPGVSKVGSYTGTGTTQQINCGFIGGARFVFIKRTGTFTLGDWYVWDSARGIVAGNDPYLLLNSTAAEVTNTDYIDTYSAGFEISSTAPAAINANGETYIFLAIA